MMREVKETLLRIENVSLELGGRKILRDVSAEIKNTIGHGQVVGILGPSGIGKTQLFRIISGLNPATRGMVFIGQTGIPVRRGVVGVVAQHYPLFEHRTVLSNLMVAALQKNLSEEKISFFSRLLTYGKRHKAAKEKALAMLEQFKLVEHRNFYPAQLSGGQRQRVAIAQQLLCSEHFLLMDEPFSGLDPVMKDKVCELITEVASKDELNTIIVTTHDIPAASAIADTLWLIGRDYDGQGNVIQGARIQETYDLVERGLAWHEGIALTPQFSDFVREIKKRFKTL